MTVDIIILSNAKNEKLKAITQQAIDTCHKSETDIKFNIVVLEQMENVQYKDCITGFIKGEFNYNKFMNVGISLTTNQYVALCNNDLLFNEGWATNLIKEMNAHKLLSACPTSRKRDGIEFGYNNNHHMNGWCIMTHRSLYDIIGELDTEFPFWFADNAYAEQLKKHKVKHAVVHSSVVKHLGSTTLNTLEKDLHNQYTQGTIKRFIDKYPNNESSIHFARVLKINI